MKHNLFNFGEKISQYNVRVLNEREVRAAAGILFFFAVISFMLAILNGNFYMTKIFVIIFLLDFFLRLFINPKYSPSLILGRFFVRNQKPEYVGAAQKKFAWGIGFILAFVMFITIVIINTFSPLNGLICMACLLLLFFESSFGICLGCKMYNAFNKEKAKLCPGGSCETHKKEKIQKIDPRQIIVVLVFFVIIFFIVSSGIIKPGKDLRNSDNTAETTNENTSDCKASYNTRSRRGRIQYRGN